MPVLSVLAGNWVMRIVAAILAVIIVVVLVDAYLDDEGSPDEALLTVEIHDFYYLPDDFRWITGSTDDVRVDVVNTGSVVHTITAAEGASFDEELAPEDRASMTVELGTIRFYCRIHWQDWSMTGTLYLASEE